MFVWRNIRSLQYLTSAYKRTFSTNSLALLPVFSWLYWAIMLWQKKKKVLSKPEYVLYLLRQQPSSVMTAAAGSRLKKSRLWPLGSERWCEIQTRQSTEAGRPRVNWGEPLNLWSKAYLKEREELVGKKKVETIPRPVYQPMRARPREKVGGPFSKVSGLELPVVEGLRQGFVSSSPTQGKDYDQVYVSRHQKAATLPHWHQHQDIVRPQCPMVDKLIPWE